MHTKRFDILGDLNQFTYERSKLILQRQYEKFCLLQNINLFIKFIYEYKLPNLYITRSGCEIEDFQWYGGQEKYSEKDSIRIIGSLITHNFNESIVNLSIGSYHSSINILRSIFEWELKVVASITDLSILTNDKSHKNKISCFVGLRNLEYANSFNRRNKSKQKEFRKSLITTPPRDENLKDFLELISSTIDSYTKIIKKLDSRILSELKFSNKTPQEGLLNLYSNSSRMVHFSIQEVDSICMGGTKLFYDKKEFEGYFNLIINLYDTIVYFYLIILDLDVYHLYSPKDRYKKRATISTEFKDVFKTRKYLKSSRALLNSETWLSKNGTSFI